MNILFLRKDCFFLLILDNLILRSNISHFWRVPLLWGWKCKFWSSVIYFRYIHSWTWDILFHHFFNVCVEQLSNIYFRAQIYSFRVMGSCTAIVKCRNNFNILFTIIIYSFFIYYSGTSCHFPQKMCSGNTWMKVMVWIPKETLKMPKKYSLYHYNFNEIKILFSCCSFAVVFLRNFSVNRSHEDIGLIWSVPYFKHLQKYNFLLQHLWHLHTYLSSRRLFFFSFLSKNFEFLSEIIFFCLSHSIFVFTRVYLFLQTVSECTSYPHHGDWGI